MNIQQMQASMLVQSALSSQGGPQLIQYNLKYLRTHTITIYRNADREHRVHYDGQDGTLAVARAFGLPMSAKGILSNTLVLVNTVALATHACEQVDVKDVA